MEVDQITEGLDGDGGARYAFRPVQISFFRISPSLGPPAVRWVVSGGPSGVLEKFTRRRFVTGYKREEAQGNWFWVPPRYDLATRLTISTTFLIS